MLKLARHSQSMSMLAAVFRRECTIILSTTFIMIVVILFVSGGIYHL